MYLTSFPLYSKGRIFEGLLYDCEDPPLFVGKEIMMMPALYVHISKITVQTKQQTPDTKMQMYVLIQKIQ